MPYDLPLPPPWWAQGWRAKIFENERLEEPHVTVLAPSRVRAWRVSLRTAAFMTPPGGRRREVPAPIRRCLRRNWRALQREWDCMYPGNPVGGRHEAR